MDRAATPETSVALVGEGQRVFRFDTFGDERLWTDTLRLHDVVEKSVDPTTGTDNNDGKIHAPAETGVNGAYAARTASKAYRTTPLRALWQHSPYFHDGSAATLADVVTYYNRVRALSLTAEQQRDLVEYLKSL